MDIDLENILKGSETSSKYTLYLNIQEGQNGDLKAWFSMACLLTYHGTIRTNIVSVTKTSHLTHLSHNTVTIIS